MVEGNFKPLLDWLLLKHADTPRNRAKQWIRAGRVSVKGEVIRKPHQELPDPGDTLELRARHTTTLACGSGWQIHPRLSLLYLDSALAVVNKGPGLLSVPAPGRELSALSVLADFLAGRLKAQTRGIAGRSLPSVFRRLEPMAVHRLDEYTSGVFCMATNPLARRHLIDQLKAHTMRREYVAFVEGRASARQGAWRQVLQLTQDEMRQKVLPGTRPGTGSAREAITYYEVIAEYPLAGGKAFVTKLRLRLETGLKHQIRAQAASAGLPLVGDRTYNPGCGGSGHPDRFIVFPRQALHSEVLTLEHPDRPGTPMIWTASLPADLRQLEAALRSARL